MPAFIYPIKNIPLGKFDLGGVLYHANYFYLYELAREALLNEIQHPYSELVKNGYHLAITESQQKFKKPIFYGDQLELQLDITDLRKIGFTVNYKIYCNGILVHMAVTKHVLVKKGVSGFTINKLDLDFFRLLKKHH